MAVLRVVIVCADGKLLHRIGGRRIAIGVRAELRIIGASIDLELVEIHQTAVDKELRRHGPGIGVDAKRPHGDAGQVAAEHDRVVI
jgi:hypothetical protein